jgi:ATP-dependent RNA helicase DDX24/MAK5
MQHCSSETLPWKTVARPSEAGMGGDEGILEFEEVENVEIVYEETEHGRVVRFNVGSLQLIEGAGLRYM